MVEKTWRLTEPEGDYIVRLVHNPFVGWLRVNVNEREIYYRVSKLKNPGLDTTIRVGRHLLPLKIERCGEAFSYSLEFMGRVVAPQTWPLPPGSLHLTAARENILRTGVYTGILVFMAILSIIVYSDVAAMTGLMVFGIPSLVYCWRLGDLVVTRLEINSLGIAQQRLLGRREIAWDDVEQVLVDQDGQCRVEGNSGVIVIRAGVFTDLRPLAWWVEFMAEKRAIKTPRFGEGWIFRYSRILLPLAVGLALAAIIWLGRTPVILGAFGGLLTGWVWSSQVGNKSKKQPGSIPFTDVLIPSGMIFGLLLPRMDLLTPPLMVLGMAVGFLLFTSLARDVLVRLLQNQGMHI